MCSVTRYMICVLIYDVFYAMLYDSACDMLCAMVPDLICEMMFHMFM